MFGHFRRLNIVKLSGKYALSQIRDLNVNIINKRIIEFAYMLFGVKTSALSSQRLANEVFSGLEFVYVYVDDVLICSNDKEEQMRHL